MKRWFWIVLALVAILVAAYVINKQMAKRKENENTTTTTPTEAVQQTGLPDLEESNIATEGEESKAIVFK